MKDTSIVVVPGSLSAISETTGQAIAETFLSADVIVLVDTSSSMDTNDSRGRKTRYAVAVEELKQLQANLPGKIAVLSFSSETIFCPGGVPLYQGAGTDMAGALKFARVADVPGMRFILISDGKPCDEQETLEEAAKYKNRIDTVFVGPEERPAGRDFLRRLAEAHQGQNVTATCAQELAKATTQLLLGTK